MVSGTSLLKNATVNNYVCPTSHATMYTKQIDISLATTPRLSNTKHAKSRLVPHHKFDHLPPTMNNKEYARLVDQQVKLDKNYIVRSI